MKLTVPALLEWITLGEKLIDAGKGPFDAVMATVATHGITQDTAACEAVIIDAERRKAIAQAEATR